MGQKLPNIHCLVDKTMNMCESYLTYLKISGASSCRCIGIAGCLRYNQGSFTRFLRNILGLITHPHLLVRGTGERFLPAGGTFGVRLASESHWLQPILVLTVHWWPTPVCVGELLAKVKWEGGITTVPAISTLRSATVIASNIATRMWSLALVSSSVTYHSSLAETWVVSVPGKEVVGI